MLCVVDARGREVSLCVGDGLCPAERPEDIAVCWGRLVSSREAGRWHCVSGTACA